ncbi:MAG TPA: FmdB family transcriptional regulator [Opitutaceae bacterium]|nr:FmdB family transcriptional regulator [Opitutaceae bacterium]
MPIYEYYCPENHTIYQFYAKTLAQGRTVPKCPDNPRFHLVKMLSSFAVTGGGRKKAEAGEGGQKNEARPDDARMEAAMGAMEREFSQVDENDPRAMGRMMRRMAELSGEKIDGEMEEVVRKLEEGADPESLEEELGGEAACHMPDPDAPETPAPEERHRFRARRAAPVRDPRLHDYE